MTIEKNLRTQPVVSGELECRDIVESPFRYADTGVQNKDCVVKEKNMNGLKVLNVKEVSKILGVSTKTIYANVQAGVLPSQRIGKRILFLESEVLKFLRGH